MRAAGGGGFGGARMGGGGFGGARVGAMGGARSMGAPGRMGFAGSRAATFGNRGFVGTRGATFGNRGFVGTRAATFGNRAAFRSRAATFGNRSFRTAGFAAGPGRWQGNWRGGWRGNNWWRGHRAAWWGGHRGGFWPWWGVGAGLALAASVPYYDYGYYGYDDCVQWRPDWGWVNVCVADGYYPY